MKKYLKIVSVIFIIFLLIFSYGYFIEPNNLVTKEYKINASVPDSFDGIKIVHISDMHYGFYFSNKMLDKIVKEINFINPDIVFFTGDLIDKSANLNEKKITYLENSLKKINAKINKYAILGNHDYEYSSEKISKIYTNSNFILLQNSFDEIYYNSNEKIIVYGIDDVIKDKHNLEATFTNYDENLYKIVLVHEPDYVDDILKNYQVSLILSGHTHNEINIPFIKSLNKKQMAEKYNNNHYLIENTNIYISTGLGTTNFKFRLFSPPSINFYRINKEDN